MEGWCVLQGEAAGLPAENVDTDQLIPARFMSTPRSEGYGNFLLHDVRQDDPDHVLNRLTPDILVARRNFGSGSSREAAVYALVDFGIRAIFAPSFGDIFAANAINNGLLPAVVNPEEVESLIGTLDGGTGAARVDLATGSAHIAGRDLEFDLPRIWREKLINGWDDIDLTQRRAKAIGAYRRDRRRRYPWAFPAG